MQHVTTIYDDGLLRWQLGRGHPTNPERARRAVRRIDALGVPQRVLPTREARLDELLLVHDRDYVDEVLAGSSTEWAGWRPDLGQVARAMFGGTMLAVDEMLGAERVRLAFAPMGAKHHAMRAWSSGFCVFNDAAAAAVRFRDAGMRVAYVDWDAHHGDGVEELLRWERDIVTMSVHDGSIFPGTGEQHEPARGVFNWSLEENDGDEALLQAIEAMCGIIETHDPQVVIVAAGADGHEGDRLSSLTYTLDGIEEAARQVARASRGRQVLIGGAGGYQPLDVTPEAWALSVRAFAEES